MFTTYQSAVCFQSVPQVTQKADFAESYSVASCSTFAFQSKNDLRFVPFVITKQSSFDRFLICDLL